jgi:muconolactone delta-isomerase
VEFLVTMTTVVPEGTSSEAIDDVRAREAAHTGELAAQGHVLRLWRPPLAPGEWRSIGLFAAADAPGLERVLASMPLRVWRSDAVSALFPHPDDPGPGGAGSLRLNGGGVPAEFLVTITPSIPDGTPPQDLARASAQEAGRAGELAGEGYIARLWALSPEEPPVPTLALCRADDEAQLQAILESLPLHPYTKAQVTQVTPHPSDPGSAEGR